MSSIGRSTREEANNLTIRHVQRNLDDLKRKVDQVCDYDLPHLGAASPDRRSLYVKASSLKDDVTEVAEMITRLSMKNENIASSVFQSKKEQESRRVQLLQDKLDQILSQLEPDEIEEDYFRKVANDQDPSLSDINSYADQAEGAGYENDDGEEEEDSDMLEINKVQGLTDFIGEQPGDLSFRKGEVLTVIHTSEDGWWTARNSEGQEGVVPSTYLKIIDDSQDEEMAPTLQLSQHGTTKPPVLEKKRSGKDLWNMVKQPVQKKPSELDVLRAMKAMPTGFRDPTLSALLKEDSWKASAWLMPKLSESNLAFRDLFWDSVNKRLKPKPSRISRTLTLQSARMIPQPGAGLEVKSRHVRIAVWNGRKVLSNIHTVRAIPVEQDDQTWSFNPRVTRLVPSLYDGELLVRCNAPERNINLLFELNYSYVRTTTGEHGEVSCGWSSLPLFEKDGTPIVNKTYELTVHGGTPYDQNVDLDPSISIQASTSLFQSIVRTNRQPRLVVKCTSHNKLSKDTFDLLPEVFLTAQRNAKFIGYFREIVANFYLRDDGLRGGLICDPVMACFPRVLDYHDLLDALKMAWDDKMRGNLRRSQKRDPAFILSLFRTTFIESSFAIMQCADFPAFVWANDEVEKDRLRFILTFREGKEPLSMLLSRQVRFRPLNTNKVAFDVLSEHSLAMPTS